MSSNAARSGVVAGTVAEALTSATDALRAAGVESPRLDAELLLAETTGLGRDRLASDPGRGVDGASARAFGAMVRRRVAREPVAYILGRRGFRDLELSVDPRALIPRPESELLVEVALELAPRSVLDVGTGSGAIALAIADELPSAAVVAVDVSAAALELAAENSSDLGLADRVEIRLGSAAAAAGQSFDLVVANLPYVADGERSGLGREITGYEPDLALFAGADGLDVIRELVADLGPGGGLDATAVALEVGETQAGEVRRLLGDAGYGRLEIRSDLAGIDRVVVGRR